MNKQRKEFQIIYVQPPRKVAIGWGVHQTVADECKSAGMSNALIVTTGLRGTGIVEEVREVLKYNGVSSEVYDKVSSNPRDFQVMEAYEAFKAAGCDGVVSIGGGSSHDCGKGLRLVHGNDGRHVNDMGIWLDPPWQEVIKGVKPVVIPQVSINTTAGTGAESTDVGVITNTEGRFKFMIPPVAGMAPSAALIDPLFVRLMPTNYIAWTGFDAFCHAMEGYINRIPSQHTQALDLRCIKLVAENLREFTYNHMNDVACENMCWAESLAGVGLCMGAGVGIIHGCGHMIAALYDKHHGFINCVLAVPMERFNQNSCPEKFADMAAAMGVDTRGLTTMEASDAFMYELERLLDDLGITPGNIAEQLDVKEEDLEHIAKYGYNDWSREGNPRDMSVEGTVELLKTML